MSAREEILARLRLALRDVPDDETVADVPVARDYHRGGADEPAAAPGPVAAPGAVVDLFAERVDDYRATVHRCAAADVAATVDAILAECGTRTLLVPHDLPAGWYAGFTGTVHRDRADDPLSLSTLDTVDTVLTGCVAAIAETGTLILDSGAAQGRRAITLVPDHHVCVVTADQITAGVPEALTRLDPRRPLTFVSGPSATSDIEFDRVEGVHGPRRLDVVLPS